MKIGFIASIYKFYDSTWNKFKLYHIETHSILFIYFFTILIRVIVFIFNNENQIR